MPSVSQRGTSSDQSAVSLSGSPGGTEYRSSLWAWPGLEDVTSGELEKFWDSLSLEQRRDLLRVEKQTLFEQVRKNLYCSRCHGLLVKVFAQMMLYGKGHQKGGQILQDSGVTNGTVEGEGGLGVNGKYGGLYDDTDDPSVHPWSGLAVTKDSMLTLLEFFVKGSPIEVFMSARQREKERELLYPDACGSSGRGWLSQSGGWTGGRGHGMKESCALHTARLSCEALVDFWSALGEETRKSLLRMKEEDFIERLVFRFENKRFCRDCRRNVLKEFKELKELKRLKKEPRCTRWFCAADTAFRYQVTERSVHLDWHDCFLGDAASSYQRFEWAMGTSEGKGDILPFEDVGLSESVQADGLDLSGRSVCHLTVRGWKRDGRSSELWVKACAIKGQMCVHRRLLVGDKNVSITKGESIQRFFERAEEAEEEEEEEAALDKDGNELEGEGLRPQKHAKSPELARDFLLDAATVIFKEQVEKAFREGTARQNAHSLFVCLGLSLLEERVRVACKEISALEKQIKLLEEEEDEKREEEERRERRKQKEKERKQRRKEKQKGKEKKGEDKGQDGRAHVDSMGDPGASAAASCPSSGKTSMAGSDDEEEAAKRPSESEAPGGRVSEGVVKAGDGSLAPAFRLNVSMLDEADGETLEVGSELVEHMEEGGREGERVNAGNVFKEVNNGGSGSNITGGAHGLANGMGKRPQNKKGSKPASQAAAARIVSSTVPSPSPTTPSKQGTERACSTATSSSGLSAAGACVPGKVEATVNTGGPVSPAGSGGLGASGSSATPGHAEVKGPQVHTGGQPGRSSSPAVAAGKAAPGRNGVHERGSGKAKAGAAGAAEQCECGTPLCEEPGSRAHHHGPRSSAEDKSVLASQGGSKAGGKAASSGPAGRGGVQGGTVRSGPGPGPGSWQGSGPGLGVPSSAAAAAPQAADSPGGPPGGGGGRKVYPIAGTTSSSVAAAPLNDRASPGSILGLSPALATLSVASSREMGATTVAQRQGGAGPAKEVRGLASAAASGPAHVRVGQAGSRPAPPGASAVGGSPKHSSSSVLGVPSSPAAALPPGSAGPSNWGGATSDAPAGARLGRPGQSMAKRDFPGDHQTAGSQMDWATRGGRERAGNPPVLASSAVEAAPGFRPDGQGGTSAPLGSVLAWPAGQPPLSQGTAAQGQGPRRDGGASPGLTAGGGFRSPPPSAAALGSQLSPSRVAGPGRVQGMGAGGQGVLPVPASQRPAGMLGPSPLAHPRQGPHGSGQGQPMALYQARPPHWGSRAGNGMLAMPGGGGFFGLAPSTARMPFPNLAVGMPPAGNPALVQTSPSTAGTVQRGPVAVGVNFLHLRSPAEPAEPQSGGAHANGHFLARLGPTQAHTSTGLQAQRQEGGEPILEKAMVLGIYRPGLPGGQGQPFPSASTVHPPDPNRKCIQPVQDASEFSLFHFGGPTPSPPVNGLPSTNGNHPGGKSMSKASEVGDKQPGKTGLQRERADGTKAGEGRGSSPIAVQSKMDVGEYTLFSSGAGKGFGFF